MALIFWETRPFFGESLSPFGRLILHLERAEHAQKIKGKYPFPRYLPCM